jgi:PilZ domain
MSHLVDVTPFGARLRLKRPTEIGRLLLLTLAMPRQYRCFDHAEDQYRVWSLVRNLKMLNSNQEKGALIELGVAFVGKRPPPSFEIDPARRYEISKATTVGGLWVVTEEGGGHLAEVPIIDDKRKESRHSIPIEVLIEVFDEKGALTLSERTVTENLSRHGAAVFTSLDVSPGRFVRVTSEHHGNTVLAVVRTCRLGPDHIPRLHLEFIGGEWEL